MRYSIDFIRETAQMMRLKQLQPKKEEPKLDEKKSEEPSDQDVNDLVAALSESTKE